MFDNIFAAIEKWMRELLSGMVESNLSTMFTAVNQQTSEIAAQVGQTPQGWNSSIFSMIRNISDSVVIPIAGIIITLILCYELISMLTERNNLHDVDTWMFFKYFVKMWIAVYLVSHTFDIAMAVFDIGQSVVNSSSGIIRGNTAIDISSLSMQMQAAMATMAIGELVTLALETLVVSWCLKILSVVITVIMEEALEAYDKIPSERMNADKCIGFCIEEDGGFVGMYELVVNDKVQRENINSINYFRDDKLVQQAISDMEKLMEARQKSKEQERSSTKKSVLDALRSLKAKKQEQPAQEQDKPKKAKKKGMEL